MATDWNVVKYTKYVFKATDWNVVKYTNSCQWTLKERPLGQTRQNPLGGRRSYAQISSNHSLFTFINKIKKINK